jgi:predicted nuclease with TOPRIM domain
MQNKIHDMIDCLGIEDRLRNDLKILFDDVTVNDSGIEAIENLIIQIRDNENWKDKYEELEADKDLEEANDRIEELESENEGCERDINRLEDDISHLKIKNEQLEDTIIELNSQIDKLKSNQN